MLWKIILIRPALAWTAFSDMQLEHLGRLTQGVRNHLVGNMSLVCNKMPRMLSTHLFSRVAMHNAMWEKALQAVECGWRQQFLMGVLFQLTFGES